VLLPALITELRGSRPSSADGGATGQLSA